MSLRNIRSSRHSCKDTPKYEPHSGLLLFILLAPLGPIGITLSWPILSRPLSSNRTLQFTLHIIVLDAPVGITWKSRAEMMCCVCTTCCDHIVKKIDGSAKGIELYTTLLTVGEGGMFLLDWNSCRKFINLFGSCSSKCANTFLTKMSIR